jgi:hypothetical protein
MNKIEFHFEKSAVFLLTPVIGIKFNKKEQIYSYNAYEVVIAWGFWMGVIVIR